MQALEIEALAAYLAPLMASPSAAVDGLTRIHGGASRETYAFDLLLPNGARHGLILRRDPPASLIDTERAVEFAAYRSVHGKGVPVPRAIALEASEAVLGRPFFVMERIDGGAAASPFTPDAYGEHAAVLGAQVFDTLGRLATIPAAGSALAAHVPVPLPLDAASAQLAHWKTVLAAQGMAIQPVVEGAIRWLERRPPTPPPRVTIVHGDYRSGNFLHDGAGTVLAVLDWEMAHFGDPLEDLAWALDPMWSHGAGLAGGMIPRDEAIARWSAASGLAFDAAAFAWWEVFSMVKGMVIWTTSAKTFAEGRNIDPVLAFSGWYCHAEHERLLAERMEREALHA
jgi:aminoglycoside phosphotransferase (APT) family kinase protein